jgi:hypothetical protein
LTVKYKDGENKIIVPPGTPIVTFVPGDKADLKTGIKIFIGAAKKLPDGTLQAARVNYGKDGLTPPMWGVEAENELKALQRHAFAIVDPKTWIALRTKSESSELMDGATKGCRASLA